VAYRERLNAGLALRDQFGTVPFGRMPGALVFMERAFALTSLLVIPICWYFGSVREVVAAWLGAVC
jgi:hypothetical protein